MINVNYFGRLTTTILAGPGHGLRRAPDRLRRGNAWDIGDVGQASDPGPRRRLMDAAKAGLAGGVLKRGEPWGSHTSGFRGAAGSRAHLVSSHFCRVVGRNALQLSPAHGPLRGVELASGLVVVVAARVVVVVGAAVFAAPTAGASLSAGSASPEKPVGSVAEVAAVVVADAV